MKRRVIYILITLFAVVSKPEASFAQAGAAMAELYNLGTSVAAGGGMVVNDIGAKVLQTKSTSAILAELWNDAVTNIQSLATLEEQLRSAMALESTFEKIYSTASAINLGRQSVEMAYEGFNEYVTISQVLLPYCREMVEKGNMSLRDFSTVMNMIDTEGKRCLRDIRMIPEILKQDGKTISEREKELEDLYRRNFWRTDRLLQYYTDMVNAENEKALYESLTENMDLMYGEYGTYSPKIFTIDETRIRAKEIIENEDPTITSKSDGGKALKQYAKSLASGLNKYMMLVRTMVIIIALLLSVPTLIRVNNGEAQSANSLRKLVFVTIGFMLLIEIFNMFLKYFFKLI